mgnify:CR=1 FL=1
MSVSLSRNMPWIGRKLTVVESTDSSLIGRSGCVVNETLRTVTVLEGDDRKVVFGKSSIKFHLDEEDEIIDGSKVQIRPEDRINRRFKNSGE